MALLANDLIMLGTSIRSFIQNMSFISEYIGRARMVQHFGKNGRTEEERKNGGGTEYSCLR